MSVWVLVQRVDVPDLVIRLVIPPKSPPKRTFLTATHKSELEIRDIPCSLVRKIRVIEIILKSNLRH
jgi:hypothetical protein